MSKINLNVLRWIFRAWRYRLVVEKHEIQFMLNHLKLGYTAIDIGAHKGAYTYWMSKYVGNEGRVFSFEPQPVLYNQLVSLIKHSNNKNINLEASALSSTPIIALLSPTHATYITFSSSFTWAAFWGRFCTPKLQKKKSDDVNK